MARSKSTIEKHKQSLHRGFFSSLCIEQWQEYADVQFTHNNRKHPKDITLRQYYDYLKSGKTAKTLQKEGYSKHVLHFYNKLLKNEINLTKQQFEQDYLDGVSLDEISRKYKISRENTTFLRELYGIKRKGAKYIKRKSTEVSLTDHQKELIYGSLMGDGKKSSDSSFCVKHSSKAEEYVLWKYSILENVVSANSLKKEKYFDKRFDKWYESMRFYTYANSDVEDIIFDFFNTGCKSVTKKILDQLTDFSVAVWYMDDGKINWSHRSRKKGWNSRPSVALCTDSFGIKECELIVQWFKDRYAIECYLREVRHNQFRVLFNVDATEKFLKIVRPYIISSMLYKIDYDQYLCKIGEIASPQVLNKLSDCPLGENFKLLDHKSQDMWVNTVLKKLRNSPFPYPVLSATEISRFIKRLSDFDSSQIISDDEIKYRGYPSSFAQFFHPDFYKMKSKGSLSPYQIFNDDMMLQDIIRKCIINSEYPTKAAIRRKINRYRGNKMATIFPYFGAKAVYDKFCKPDGLAIDFCAGFGSRMLGALTSKNISKYVACEPHVKTYNGLLKMMSTYSKYDNHNKTEIDIFNNTAEVFLSTLSQKPDIIFTSPPYFSTEIHGKEQSQSCVSHPSYGYWLQNWMFKCIDLSINALNAGGTLILNIANAAPYMIADNVCEYIESNGLNVLRQRIFISANTHEPMIVVRV